MGVIGVIDVWVWLLGWGVDDDHWNVDVFDVDVK
jgi:hypothetical protein